VCIDRQWRFVETVFLAVTDRMRLRMPPLIARRAEGIERETFER
jgi:hypothetical protein